VAARIFRPPARARRANHVLRPNGVECWFGANAFLVERALDQVRMEALAHSLRVAFKPGLYVVGRDPQNRLAITGRGRDGLNHSPSELRRRRRVL
jgi:hypothetical protein